MPRLKAPLTLFFVSVIVIALLAMLGPEEQSLGSNVRIVYLHGAWVMAAELAFIAAGAIGLIGLLSRRKAFHQWSAALGRTGIIFWTTYLPLSLWAMQANWSGLFLAEPRFRLGLWLINTHWVTSLANLLFIVALRIAFATAQNIMHPPPSPIFGSGNFAIIGFFLALVALTLAASFFLTRVLLQVSK